MRNLNDGFSRKSDAGAANWRRALMSCVAVFSIAIVLSGPFAAQVRAADDEDEDTIETKFIKGLFGINNRDSINYRERAPLVVPPNLDRLPAPEKNALVELAGLAEGPGSGRTEEARRRQEERSGGPRPKRTTAR